MPTQEEENEKLSGVCEIDGVYVGNYIRPANNIKDRIDRRKANKPKKRVVISIRQRSDNEFDEVVGAVKTKTFITKSEESRDIKELVYKNIETGSELHSDEHQGYDIFHAHYDMKRVNHSKEYKSIEGACNNQSESYNSRFRRMEYGQCHHISNLYLSNYANEIAYREDTRRMSNGAIFNDITTRCMNTPVSNEFCGYWQGNKRLSERLGA